MTKVFAILIAFYASVACAQMPENVRKTIDENLVGSWEASLDFDGKVTIGTIVNRWSEGNLSVVSSQHFFVDGKKDEVSSVIGWQPDSKSVVEHGFASSGDYWTIRWTELNDDSWSGEGEGIYLGEKWKSATKIRFSGNAYRYEDVTKGKPYVIKCKRVAANAAELFATHAEFMSGGKWTTTDAGDGMKIVDSHILSDDKKFVRIESQKPREGFTTVYGVDPRTKELTLWGFSEDGGFAKWICTGHDGNTWTWKGIKYAPDGTKPGVATLTKAGEDKMEFTIQNDGEELKRSTWSRSK